jgi:PadR family transcriptional regulator, regulatory protein AphA
LNITLVTPRKQDYTHSVSTSSASRTSPPSPEYALLGFLKQQPTHGYDLHQQLTTHLGQVWRISLSQAYNILNRLETQGYIIGATQEQNKLPDRRRFRLTASGRRRFDTWLGNVSGCSVHAIRIEFTTRLYFAQGVGRDTMQSVIETQITQTQSCLERLQTLYNELPTDQTFNRLGTELRIRQLTSAIAWMRDCGTAMGISINPAG